MSIPARLATLAFTLLLWGCVPFQQQPIGSARATLVLERSTPVQRPKENAMSDLADQLVTLGYTKLFLRLSTAELDRIWDQPDGPALLEAVVSDTSTVSDARVLAAEILFRKQLNYTPPTAVRPTLATAYAQVLSTADLANSWGMPGELDGPLGKHVVVLGEDAVAALRPLLDDPRDVSYGGSQAAMVGNSYSYRVKDFAAFFISRIRNLPYTVVKEPAARDQAITQLRTLIGAR